MSDGWCAAAFSFWNMKWLNMCTCMCLWNYITWSLFFSNIFLSIFLFLLKISFFFFAVGCLSWVCTELLIPRWVECDSCIDLLILLACFFFINIESEELFHVALPSFTVLNPRWGDPASVNFSWTIYSTGEELHRGREWMMKRFPGAQAGRILEVVLVGWKRWCSLLPSSKIYMTANSINRISMFVYHGENRDLYCAVTQVKNL